MKVYTEIVKKNHTNLERLEKYFYKTQNETFIYSDDGIFKLENNNICKVIIKDDNIEYKKNYYENTTLYVDKSETKFVSMNGQIPYNHTILKMKKMHYRLFDNAVITFCVELANNNIHNYYFITKENIDNCLIKKDIVTFLSLLK